MNTDNGYDHTWSILRDVIHRLDPRRLVRHAVTFDDALKVAGIGEDIPCDGRLVVVAVGKASVPMATGALDSLSDGVSEAIAVTKAGLPLSVDPPEHLEILEADHPVPSARSLEAGSRVLELVDGLDEDDVVLMLISGGGSALVESLVEGVTLDDLQGATDHMLRAGATINELNAVRRRISRLKGGRLARTIHPARVVNLIVSDVLNSPLQDIASGPTVEPPENDETFASVMRRPELIDGLPGSIRSHLEAQQAESWPGNEIGTTILADARTAAQAAVDAAAGLGYHVQTLGFDFQGEAREFGRTWATIARHAAREDRAFPRPLALIGAGELTVTVRGDGNGGRNTEMALAAALEISGVDGVTVCSFATDGDDGVSGCAGGIVNGRTAGAASESGFDVPARLNENDSGTLLAALNSAIDIGTTGTNVNDLYLALIVNTDTPT